MYEHMASLFGGPPNEAHFALYSKWAAANWGMILTGNIQVAKDHLSLGRDIVIPEVLTEESIKPFEKLAKAMHGPGTTSGHPLAIMQLSHGGRQSANILGGRWPFVPPLAPSAVRLDLDAGSKSAIPSVSGLLSRFLFQTPREMSAVDIDMTVEAFVRGAKLAAQSGFDGVELHASHGCTFSPSFLLLHIATKHYQT